jgi:hypothetical protein
MEMNAVRPTTRNLPRPGADADELLVLMLVVEWLIGTDAPRRTLAECMLDPAYREEWATKVRQYLADHPDEGKRQLADLMAIEMAHTPASLGGPQLVWEDGIPYWLTSESVRKPDGSYQDIFDKDGKRVLRWESAIPFDQFEAALKRYTETQKALLMYLRACVLADVLKERRVPTIVSALRDYAARHPERHIAASAVSDDYATAANYVSVTLDRLEKSLGPWWAFFVTRDIYPNEDYIELIRGWRFPEELETVTDDDGGVRTVIERDHFAPPGISPKYASDLMRAYDGGDAGDAARTLAPDDPILNAFLYTEAHAPVEKLPEIVEQVKKYQRTGEVPPEIVKAMEKRQKHQEKYRKRTGKPL